VETPFDHPPDIVTLAVQHRQRAIDGGVVIARIKQIATVENGAG
jgi:hypothetical protein